jgi:hypothetical protein
LYGPPVRAVQAPSGIIRLIMNSASKGLPRFAPAGHLPSLVLVNAP